MIRGEIFDFTAEPLPGKRPEEFSRYIMNGALVLEKGHILDVGHYPEIRKAYPRGEVEDYRGKLITPGFIDAHIHYPQREIIGSFGKQLMEWLKNYTFPVESRFTSSEYAGPKADEFIAELIRNGTTTCMAFATEHKTSVDELFRAASVFNMRLICGKVLMNRNAPSELQDTPSRGYRESRELIEKWHNQGRNLYALTPRFAITCDMDELKVAGTLHREHPSTYIQTHLAENRKAIEATLSLFPRAPDYLSIYEEADMLTDRTVFAHGIYLSDSEMERISRAGGVIAHCPTSNLFLGSGLFDIKRANEKGMKSVIATDVGAGTSFSLLRTIGEAYKVAQLKGYPLTTFEGYYKATLGAARALHLEDKIGSFRKGNEGDLIVLDYKTPALQKSRMEYLKKRDQWTLENLLFGLQTLGDDRNVDAVYIMGERVL